MARQRTQGIPARPRRPAAAAVLQLGKLHRAAAHVSPVLQRFYLAYLLQRRRPNSPYSHARWRPWFGPAVRRLRTEHGWNRAQLAERIEGLSGDYLAKIEQGKRVPREPLMAELAGALGVALEDLLRRAEDAAEALLDAEEADEDDGEPAAADVVSDAPQRGELDSRRPSRRRRPSDARWGREMVEQDRGCAPSPRSWRRAPRRAATRSSG